MLESNIGYEFKNKELLFHVLVRKSAVNEGLVSMSLDETAFSRMKFMGTHLLALLASHMLFTTDLFNTEENLTRALANIISHEGLIVEAALQIKLGEALIVGHGEAINGFYNNPHVLAEHMQALLGAIWLDSQRDMTILNEVFRTIFTFVSHDDQVHRIIEIPDGIAPTSNFIHLQRNLGYFFQDMNLLLNACVRRSALEESVVNASTSFQTLEFLGDKVLGCITADWLLKHLEDHSADSLVPMFTALVSNHTLLPEIADEIGLGPSLIIGAGEEKQAVRQNKRKLADHLEALFAGMWLDTQRDYHHNYDVVYKLLSRQLSVIVKQDTSQRFKPLFRRLHKEIEVRKKSNRKEAFPSLPGSRVAIDSETRELPGSYLKAATTGSAGALLCDRRAWKPRRHQSKANRYRNVREVESAEPFPSLPGQSNQADFVSETPKFSYLNVATKRTKPQETKQQGGQQSIHLDTDDDEHQYPSLTQ